MWLSLGPEEGGIAGYVGIDEADGPGRIVFLPNDANDYLSLLEGIWFKTEDIEKLKDPPRFTTYPDLVRRWSGVPSSRPKAFIWQKIAEAKQRETGEESKLRNRHPMTGETGAWIGSHPGFDADTFPRVEEALFYLSDVEDIERSELGVDAEKRLSISELKELLIRTARETALRLTDRQALQFVLSVASDLSDDGLRERINAGTISAMSIVRDATGDIDLGRTVVAASEAKRIEQLTREEIVDAYKRWQLRDAQHEQYCNSEEGKRYWQLLYELEEVEQKKAELEWMRATSPRQYESQQRQLRKLDERKKEVERQLDEIDQQADSGDDTKVDGGSWHVTARQYADETARSYRGQPFTLSKQDIAKKVAERFRGEGIEGPRGPLNAETIRRHGLNNWKKPRE